MKKKLYLLLAICSIAVLALAACTDDGAKDETQNETQGPTDDENTLPETTNPADDGTEGLNGAPGANGVDGAGDTNDSPGSGSPNGTHGNGDDDGVLDDIEDGIEDGANDLNDTINDATDDN